MIAALLTGLAFAGPVFETTTEWPANVCPMADMELEAEPSVESVPGEPGDGPPVIEMAGEPVDESEPWEPLGDEPGFVVLPWRAVYRSDGSFSLWHDERCVPDGVVAVLGDPGGMEP